jgi:hypothetical protein
MRPLPVDLFRRFPECAAEWSRLPPADIRRLRAHKQPFKYVDLHGITCAERADIALRHPYGKGARIRSAGPAVYLRRSANRVLFHELLPAVDAALDPHDSLGGGGGGRREKKQGVTPERQAINEAFLRAMDARAFPDKDSDLSGEPKYHGSKEQKSRFQQLYALLRPGLQELRRKTGIPPAVAVQVLKRGGFAYYSSHRTGMTQYGWALARLAAFVTRGRTFYSPDHLLVQFVRSSANPGGETAKKWFARVKKIRQKEGSAPTGAAALAGKVLPANLPYAGRPGRHARDTTDKRQRASPRRPERARLSPRRRRRMRRQRHCRHA